MAVSQKQINFNVLHYYDHHQKFNLTIKSIIYIIILFWFCFPFLDHIVVTLITLYSEMLSHIISVVSPLAFYTKILS